MNAYFESVLAFKLAVNTGLLLINRFRYPSARTFSGYYIKKYINNYYTFNFSKDKLWNQEQQQLN